MTDPYRYGTPPPSMIAQSDDKTMPIVVYALFLAGYFTGGLSPIVGVIVAYVSKGSAQPLSASHFDFQIRTFWLSIAGGVLATVLFFMGAIMVHASPVFALFSVIGCLVMLVQTVWFIIRCIVGLVRVMQDQPSPDPRSLLI